MTEAQVQQVMDYLTNAVNKMSGIVAEHAPDIIEQMLLMGAFNAKIWLSAFLTLLIIGIFILLKGLLSDYDSGGLIIIGFFTCFICIIAVVTNAQTLYKIKNCPKLYVIQNIKTLNPAK